MTETKSFKCNLCWQNVQRPTMYFQVYDQLMQNDEYHFCDQCYRLFATWWENNRQPVNHESIG